MAPNPRAVNALRAMKALGIDAEKVKPVLKKLLKAYDKNWDFIESESYRVLLDAIFDDDDDGDNKKEPENAEDYAEHDEPERPLKRLRKGHEGNSSPTLNGCNPGSNGVPQKIPKAEKVPATVSSQHLQPGPISPRGNAMGAQPSPLAVQGSPKSSQPSPTDPLSPEMRHSYKGKEPMIPEVTRKDKRPMLERASPTVRIKEPVANQGIIISSKQKAPVTHALVDPKPEPFTGDDMQQYEGPISVIRPVSSYKTNSSPRSSSNRKTNGQEHLKSHCVTEENGGNAPLGNGRNNNELVAVVQEESATNLEIASSSMGEVKLSLSCNSVLGRPNFHMPSQEELLKSIEERCLRSYKILDPNFSVMKILKDMCECFLELATDSSHEPQESFMTITPNIDMLKRSAARSALGVGANGVSNCIPASISNGIGENAGIGAEEDMELGDTESHSLVVVPQFQLAPDELRSLHYLNDITKGEEMVEIPWFNEMSNEYPSSFNYIAHSLVFQSAYVNFALSRIGAENCCTTCMGDCLSSHTPCVCANETGNEFAYTIEGLVKDEFLEGCISLSRDPQQQSLSYCKDCPVERSKNDGIIEPCKGHLKRKFIKECWSKCGCHKQCGNRVVQRGIRCKLQVFLTTEGKGWGLRTLEKLPKGAFVCEFVGEILTTKELHERTLLRKRGTSSGRHAYPVLLDAYWYLKGDVSNEEALCLDATFHGNVARFINHRCLDANLIEIPVKMETPDDHYYHLAFFTTREVSAFEELTWDYGIDFDDNDQLVEAFRCKCSSKFCRNMKRSNRSKLSSR